MITAECFENKLGLDEGVVLLEDGEVITAMSTDAAEETHRALGLALLYVSPMDLLIQWAKEAQEVRYRFFEIRGNSPPWFTVTLVEMRRTGGDWDEKLVEANAGAKTFEEAVSDAMNEFYASLSPVEV